MNHDRSRILSVRCPHFITGTAVHRQPLFSRPEVARFILEFLAFLHIHGRLVLYAYVILENHLHLVASSDSLGEELEDFKSFTSRRIVEHLKDKDHGRILRRLYSEDNGGRKSDLEIWERGGWPRRVDSPETMRRTIDHLHANPVRRGYVSDPVHWRYSSASNYATGRGLIPVFTGWMEGCGGLADRPHTVGADGAGAQRP